MVVIYHLYNFMQNSIIRIQIKQYNVYFIHIKVFLENIPTKIRSFKII